LLGSRNGGAIAAAWASLMALGESGFLDAVRRTIETTHYFIKEIGKIDGLRIVGTPHATLFAFESTNTSQLNIYHVSDALEELGWHMERQ
jgi:glutamate/tyrosine decarboxylase-like PLP-dependent enzyme